MITLIKKYFAVEEVRGDNYNDITVLLAACNSINELAELWERLNSGGKLKTLSRNELMKVVRFKNDLKSRFMKVSLKHPL